MKNIEGVEVCLKDQGILGNARIIHVCCAIAGHEVPTHSITISLEGAKNVEQQIEKEIAQCVARAKRIHEATKEADKYLAQWE